jgi:FkbM family methyltransferase
MFLPKKAQALRASGLFDETWYRQRYPDVAASGMDLVQHYLRYGASEGRDPGPAFDSLWYLEANPDVARAGINPLYHYISSGKREGRKPQPPPGLMRTRSAAGDAKSASLDEAARCRFENSAIRSSTQQLFEIADSTVAEILALNSDAWSAIANRPRDAQAPLTIVVSHNEISNAHGTGILIKRLFGDTPSVVTIRSYSNFDGKDEMGFVNIWLGNKMLSDQQLYRLFSFLLAGQRVRAVICIPYDDLDLRTGLRLAEVLSAPFVLYTMDDNNVIGRRISDYTMGRAVSFATLRLVISTEMRQAYEAKFRTKFFVLPPLVPPELLREEVLPDSVTRQRGVIVGNIWRQSCLDEILRTTDDCGIELDWICNTSKPAWLRFDRKEIAERGIHFVNPLPESQLVDRIRNSPFCLLPSAIRNEDSSTLAIARLSLPSRVVLVVAACQTPIIIVGDNTTAAARFVLRFGVGVVARYQPDELRQAVATALDPTARRQMRDNALAIAGQFSSQGIADWLFRSIDAGQAIDDRFERFLATAPGEISMYIDRPCPDNVDPDRVDAFRALRRLKGRGFNPDFIIDAGASDGVWSRAIVQLFPEARFLLIEPLLSRYRARSSLRSIEAHPNFELIEVALLDKEGKVEMQVSGDIYNSSTLGVRLTGVEEIIKVPAVMLDALVRTRDFRGRGLLKIDVQYAEHLVLDGAKNLLQNNLDAVIIEMTLRREHPDSYTFIEICNKMRHLGFDYEDDAGEWRSPIDGRLEQKDVLFIRQNAAFA